jgi:hypothetical protein
VRAWPVAATAMVVTAVVANYCAREPSSSMLDAMAAMEVLHPMLWDKSLS